MTQCIQKPELEDFVRGKINVPRADQIATHVDACQVCQDTVVALSDSGDTFVDGFQRLDAENEVEQEQEFKHGLQRLLKGLQRKPQSDDGSSPSTIGPYVIAERLGVGGMGTVFLAEHSKLKRVVAVKILPSHRWSNAAAIARFEREMEAIGQMDHPYIVRASDAGEDQGMHYLVMEYVDGLDLGRISKRIGQLPVADACELARQAALGLHHAHSNDLVHRDIKPSNLMLAWSKSGEVSSEAKPTLKILDLGLALLGDEHLRDGHDVTTVGALMGTLDYMSPEQGIDSHGVDHRADIYGLGATLYKLLTGRAPYADPQYHTLMKKMTALATKPAPSVGLVRPDLPTDVVEIVDRMLARDPDERFSDARTVAEALQTPAQGAQLDVLLRRALATPEEAEPAPTATLSPLLGSAVSSTSDTSSGAGRNVGIGAILLAAAAAILCAVGAFVFHVVTDYGTVKVTSVDPDARVVLKQGEETVDRLTLEQGQGSTTVRSGDYVVEILGQTSGLRVEPSNVSVTRRGKVSVSVVRDHEVGPPQDDDIVRSKEDDLPANVESLHALKTDINSLNSQIKDTAERYSGLRQQVDVKSTPETDLAIFKIQLEARSLKDQLSDRERTYNRILRELAENQIAQDQAVRERGSTQSQTMLSYLDLTQRLEWETYSPGLLEQLQSDEQHVMLLFEADWCVSCKALKEMIGNSTALRRALSQKQVHTVSADWTDQKENTVGKLLVELQGQAQLPFLVILQNGSMQDAVRVAAGVTEQQLVEIIRNLPPPVRSLEFQLSSQQFKNLPLAPRYEGLSLNEWLEELKYERSPDRLKKALQAVASMVPHPDNREQLDRSIEAIFGLMRQFGHRSTMVVSTYLAEKSWQTLVELPPEVTMNRIMREIGDGNAKSREFLTYFLIPTLAEVNISTNAPFHRSQEITELLGERAAEIALLCHEFEGRDLDWAVEFLFVLGAKCHIDYREVPEAMTVFQTAMTRLADRDDPKTLAMAVHQLARTSKLKHDVVTHIADLLSTKVTPQNVATGLPAIYLGLEATEFLQEGQESLVPNLIALLDSAVVHHESQYMPTAYLSWLPGFQASQVGLGFGSSQQVFLPAIVRILKEMGPAARPAVPSLLKLYQNAVRSQGVFVADVKKLRDALEHIDPSLNDLLIEAHGQSENDPVIGLNGFGERVKSRSSDTSDEQTVMFRLEDDVSYSDDAAHFAPERYASFVYAAVCLRDVQRKLGQQLTIYVEQAAKTGPNGVVYVPIATEKELFSVQWPLGAIRKGRDAVACITHVAKALAARTSSETALEIDLTEIVRNFKLIENPFMFGGMGGGMMGGSGGGMMGGMGGGMGGMGGGGANSGGMF